MLRDDKHYYLLNELRQILNQQMVWTIDALISNACKAQPIEAPPQSTLQGFEKAEIFKEVSTNLWAEFIKTGNCDASLEPQAAGLFFASCLEAAYSKARAAKYQAIQEGGGD